MKLLKVILIIAFISIIGSGAYLIVKDRRGTKAEKSCREVQIGELETEVIKRMGEPRRIKYYFDNDIQKQLRVLKYPLPLLASSNIDIVIDPATRRVVYTVCNEP